MNILYLILIVVVALVLLGVVLKIALFLIPIAAIIFAAYMIYTALQRSKGGRL